MWIGAIVFDNNPPRGGTERDYHSISVTDIIQQGGPQIDDLCDDKLFNF